MEVDDICDYLWDVTYVRLTLATQKKELVTP